ncbi:four-carbon acid sugar kinase family protein [Bacillus litorisediminis]|uniref:four-carbon acid sugar kinase family protein n=1 Tax=Bacillus litorisediminis TaxID=2922713 RepID=UPI001FAF7F31|nr:four-carbon acid sugar kinase family protein [Bacillus litorisediminis]
MTEKMGIIADDLTGSNDSGVQLAKKGFTSTVVFNVETKGTESASDVLVIDTDSRSRSSEEAFEAVSMAASFLLQQGYTHIYKKMDSTLRGNIGSELFALADVYRPDAVVIAPAFPALNRTTVNGNHYVNGKLIHETEFGQDPKTPVHDSYIPALLEQVEDEKIEIVNLSVIQSGKEEVITFIEKAMEQGKSWFVCDGKTEADLEMIASSFAAIHKRIVWAGSGGLIEFLPNALGFSPDSLHHNKEMKIEKTLVVSGSLSQVTKKQLESLRDFDDSCLIELNPIDFVNHNIQAVESILRTKEILTAKNIVVFVDSSEENRLAASEAGEKLGLSGNQISEAIAAGLGRVASQILSKNPDINGLVLTGGDTAKAVCSELGVSEIQLHSEVEPGLPFGRIDSGNKEYWVVTKAGGFGTKTSLLNAVKFITGKVEQYESK